MMPKGVEHDYFELPPSSVAFFEKITMMPKGVEHMKANLEGPHYLAEKITMMPKGVEHKKESPIDHGRLRRR